MRKSVQTLIEEFEHAFKRNPNSAETQRARKAFFKALSILGRTDPEKAATAAERYEKLAHGQSGLRGKRPKKPRRRRV